MNKKVIFTIISIVALIGGITLGYFTDIWNDLPAIALTSLLQKCQKIIYRN